VIEDFKYLVSFPPHRLVLATLILGTTYFKMKKDKVLVSLNACNGDIEPYDMLEVWVQIRGPPPQMEQLENIRANCFFLGQDARN
jgi:hypothetical protein